jgi:hypothetical protein
VQESGPSHVKKYTMRCVYEGQEVLGEGNSKRNAKRDSAYKMLVKLEELKIIDFKHMRSFDPYRPIDPDKSPSILCELAACENPPQSSKRKSRKSKSKNIVLEKKISPDYGLGSIDPISRLIQIQQAKKLPEPVYELLKDEFQNHKHKFVMQVRIGDSASDKCTGIGTSKRMAKHNAAENMLLSQGYLKVHQPKPALKTVSSYEHTSCEADLNSKNASSVDKKVKFLETGKEIKGIYIYINILRKYKVCVVSCTCLISIRF